MKLCSLNNSITSYADFIKKVNKNPDDTAIKKSLDLFLQYYKLYLSDSFVSSEAKDYSEKLVSTDEYDLLFSCSNIEQVWAYIHLMVENVEHKRITIPHKEHPFIDIGACGAGLLKLKPCNHKTIYTVFLKERKNKNIEKPKTKIVALGGMGRHCIKNMQKKNYPADLFLLHDEETDSIILNDDMLVYEPDGKLNFSKIGSADNLIIVTSLAGSMCTKYIEPLVQFAKETCKNIFVIGILPFDFEGKKDIAEKNLSVINNLHIDSELFTNQSLMSIDKNMPIQEAFDLVDDTIMETIDKKVKAS